MALMLAKLYTALRRRCAKPALTTSKLARLPRKWHRSRTGSQKWLRNFAQGDKWNFCLTVGTLVPGESGELTATEYAPYWELITAFYEGVRALPFADAVKLLRNLYAAAA